MKHRYLAVLAVMAITCAGSAAVLAADPPSTDPSEVIYGRQLMTEQEIADQRQRMREAATEQERTRIRAEHHAAMQKRAQEMGVEIPATLPPARGGQGQGQASDPARDSGDDATREGPYGDKQKSKRPGKGG